MVKVVTRICNILSILIVLAVVAVGAAMIVPKIMGNDIYAVMSGSMEPYYHVGSVVIVDKHVEPEEVQIGDPITFHLGNGSVATHRVIDIDPEARTFSTKGDANEDPDMAPVSFDNLVGVSLKDLAKPSKINGLQAAGKVLLFKNNLKSRIAPPE